ncbi:late competence operon required for DNA binding and uptake [Halalkalibacterium halodurans C-125]|uniref:Late competence operon required for DNA binding and uptake n=2 Tax=Halalkalibacterium halodurans TaxID=86665 RepID=Q9KD84_HALH5|nr:late competence operon required for DNA binding and uptake [Halalkalibacterium halodurans C-125]
MKFFPLTKREQLVSVVALIFALIVSVMVFLAFGNVGLKENNQAEEDIFMSFDNNQPLSEADEQLDGTNERLVVDVKGAVEHPGVYEMVQGERVIDVIEKAGGMTEKAAIESVNLAVKLHDEMFIYVPEQGEAEQSLPEQQNEQGDTQMVVLNRATEVELQSLPGIGPAKATAIISYREEHGAFSSLEELMNVSGIGEKSYEKLAPYLRLN